MFNIRRKVQKFPLQGYKRGSRSSQGGRHEGAGRLTGCCVGRALGAPLPLWLLLPLLLLLGGAVWAREYDDREDGPRFLSRGHTYRANIGDTLLLPCQVQNSDSLLILWKRGAVVLTAASIIITRDKRIVLVDGYNLQITQVGPRDAGDYVCQIGTEEPLEQVHTVEVLVPSMVRAMPESGHVEAQIGHGASLECRVAGNPLPSIVWTRLNDSARVGDGPQLVLQEVERGAAGRYRCTVDNGVGAPLHRDFVLQVLYPPEISVERWWVHNVEGFRAVLVCTVLADPPAEVSWYQNSFPMSPTERYLMSSHHQNHTLLITNVQPEDFGNYSCAADNSLGRARQHVVVLGRPGPVLFQSPPLSRGPHSYTLAFQLDSYPPLDELRLLYRQLMMNESFQLPGKWHDVTLPGAADASGLTHRVTHELRGLRPSAIYQVIVHAKNRYGWNEVSDIFQFHTRGAQEGPVRLGEGGPGAAHSGVALSPSPLHGALTSLIVASITYGLVFSRYLHGALN